MINVSEVPTPALLTATPNLRQSDYTTAWPFDDALSHVNTHVGLRIEQYQQMEKEELRQAVAPLLQEIQDMREYVGNFDNYHPEAKNIAKRYSEMNALTKGKDLYQRAAKRLGTAPEGDLVDSDMDDSATYGSKLYIPKIPGSIHGEELLAKLGREKFAEVFVQSWQEGLEYYPDLFFKAGQQQRQIRPGVSQLNNHLQRTGGKLQFISANFEPFVFGTLSAVPELRGTEIFAIRHNSILSTDKGTLLKHNARLHPSRALVYIGDGDSDKVAIEAADEIAVFFALEGHGFDRQLEEKGIEHFTYRDFHEITAKLMYLDSLKQSEVN